MCGIAGILNRHAEPVHESTLIAMLARLDHRGPDACGVFIDRNLGLGHTRLSIIDTSRLADQPMSNEDGTVVVIFNGEIYNFEELKADLSGRGHVFKNNSDTEVIVHAWEEFGPDSVRLLRGMFAFVVYDGRRRQLFFARDRLGQKPLYYYIGASGLVFASEMKALAALSAVEREIDPVAVGEYISFGYSLGERSIYSKIRKFPAGHSAVLDLENNQIEIEPRRYWEFQASPDPSLSREDWLELLDEKLQESVRLRMVSDVPLGAFLSGGIDSSLVVASMSKHGAQVRTFTMGFEEGTHDERPFASKIADYLGTEHDSQVVKPDALAILPELVKVYDEPFGDMSAVPTYYLCKMARERVTVALSGDGGDEFFLGYSRYSQSRILDRLGGLIGPVGRWSARLLADKLPEHLLLQRAADRLTRRDFELYLHAMGCSRERLSLLRREVRLEFLGSEQAPMREAFRGAGLLERYQNTDVHNYLPEDILVKVDRASMAHSLEVRCPLLDHLWVELAARIPIQMNVSGQSGKNLLRELLARYLPRHLFQRPKRGFGIPFSGWFGHDLYHVAREMVNHSSSRMWDYFDRPTVQKRLSRAPAEYWWRLIFFHRWCEMHLNG